MSSPEDIARPSSPSILSDKYGSTIHDTNPSRQTIEDMLGAMTSPRECIVVSGDFSLTDQDLYGILNEGTYLEMHDEWIDIIEEEVVTTEIIDTQQAGVESSSIWIPGNPTEVNTFLFTGNPGIKQAKSEMLALEEAKNTRKEIKASVHDCLQGLYEIVLSLADSRARHKYNLEKERVRNAKELVNIERFHNKQIMELKKNLAAE
ncbi:hypothetical protein PYW08_006039 [Mythimna loreyi]|uniref:Uncharacterized protein n=1 Tax=Mythimna loreyi TaxID=667449 RepID=A0ACC2QNF5_9NEOP|nr:hypothetical protein PYW08_006039 [Mythimna loreyi]